ncbi:MAG: precorrin-6Y C5,15-methyltransferase (decarboxylating) subunit CbiT [Cyanobacteria bacterium QS_8_64_29]|nr:MAG: precorrin-6Y C5,15-methyltransferase (decarboxylating) subunit CbiT [Cyanobacteria bacterium QS_8_64_29]
MPSASWPYTTPGIPDSWFEQLPGIPMTEREVRLLLLASLRLPAQGVLWDIGAGTGTIAVEAGLLSPQGQVIAIERDEEVVSLIRRNCERFGVSNVDVIAARAPDCLAQLQPLPNRICIEGGRPLDRTLRDAWEYLQSPGRAVITARNLDTLHVLSQGLVQLQASNIEIVQSAVNRLEARGAEQHLAAVDPIFVISGDKT